MKYTVSACLFLLAFLLTAPVPAAAAARPEAEFRKLSRTHVLYPDGSQEMRVRKELTLYTHAAMNSLYGETFVVYDPSCQELVVHESYTRQADGTVVRTPANAFVDVLPAAAAGAPAYNGLRETVIVHTGLELGATIVLDYSVKTRPGARPALDVYEPVAELSPIREYTCALVVPADAPLHYELINGDARPRIRETDGMKSVTWTLRNVPARPRFLALSEAAGNRMAIAATTYASPADRMAVLAAAFPAPGNAALQQRCTDLTDSDPASAVDAYVRELGDCGVTPALTGGRIRPVEATMASAYGTAAEKAALAAGLRQAAGLPHRVYAVFPKTSDPAAVGFSALQQLLVEGYDRAALEALADIQDYVSVVDLSGRPVRLERKDRTLVRESELTVTAQEIRRLGDGYGTLELPDARTGWAGGILGATAVNTTRPVSLLLPYLPHETLTCTVKPEAGVVPVALPREKQLENAAGSLSVRVESGAGGTVRIVRELRLTKQLISPRLYPAYYRLMAEWAETARTPLVFRYGGSETGPADELFQEPVE